MVVSKSLAEDIASKMLQVRTDALHKRRKEFKEFITRVYVEEMPVKIKEIYEERPELHNWLYRVSQVRINFVGELFGKYFYTTNNVPANNSTGGLLRVENKEEQDYIVAENREIERQEKELKELRSELIATLVELKSEKRIASVLPEAVQYIPTKQASNLPVSVNALREKLNLAPLPTE